MMMVVAGVTLSISLLAIRSFAPQWLGLPVDLRMVQVDERIPPFYENVFRKATADHKEFLLNDPYTLVRARPLTPNYGSASGPHDLLGFRNRAIPSFVDILIIGDSQTYGNNAPMYDNWPHVLARQVEDVPAVVYSMATGGWGAVQYLDMLNKGTAFGPEVIVVAFYTGNDPLESYRLAYSVDHWASLRAIDGVSDDDLPPPVAFPAVVEDQWPVVFADGTATIFSPKLRLRSNALEFGATLAGWAVMKRAARLMAERAAAVGSTLVFVVIPTKELVFAPRIEQDGIQPPELYQRLVQSEGDNIRNFSAYLSGLAGKPLVVDLLSVLQRAALTRVDIYPPDVNGHPMAPGYRLIGETITKAVQPLLARSGEGLFVADAPGGKKMYLLVRDGVLRVFASTELVLQNGWELDNVVPILNRDTQRLWHSNLIETVNPDLYGPEL